MEISRSKLDSNFRKILSIRDYHGSDIEQKALELYQCLSNISKSDEKYIYIYLKITLENRPLPNTRRGKLRKNFKIILLSSLRHLKFCDKPQIPMKSLVHVIVEDLLRNLDLLDFRSLYLFKVLDQVVLKKLDLISDIRELLLGKLYEVCYASPLAILKNYAVSLIHKVEMGNGMKTFNPLGNIGILTNYEETKTKLERIPTDSIHSNLQEYMKFIHKYFHFNVYNKSAGILYKAVISRYDINDFKTHIWPFWCESFEKNSDSREFQQSFFKYWIPFTVQEYKIDLYVFLREQNVSRKLLVEILFELRRRRHISIEGAFHEDLIGFMEDFETNERAFEILCTFPSLNETVPLRLLDIFEEYLLGHKIKCCNLEKQVGQFLAHIFVSGHVNILQNSDTLIYDGFLRKLRDFVINSFEDGRNLDLSSKLCKILYGMGRSGKDLKLRYDLPKKYQYGPGENRYFIYLQENCILDIFTKKKDLITGKLVKLFNQSDTFDDTLMWLLKNAFTSFDIEDLNLTNVQKGVNLHNLEKYLGSQKLGLYKTSKERVKTELILSFGMIEHRIVLVLLNVKINDDAADEIFDILKILNVLVFANQMGIAEECRPSTVENILNFVAMAVEEDLHEGLSIKTRKVLEHLFCKILTIVSISPTTLKDCGEVILNKLVVVLERSNMKKVVADVLNLIPLISEKMMSKSLEKFYRELLDGIVSPGKLKHPEKSRMRKHPRQRSLLHAVCKGSGSKQREFVEEAMKKMIWKMLQHNLDPMNHTVLLECLEILVVEPNFHSYTFVYLEEAIKLSLNSFRSDNWCVKNAAIQLTNTVITRIFGVQQTENIRLRSFQEFCVLFPRLYDHFYNILSSPMWDDRAIIVLQYLSASEVLVYEHLDVEIQKKIDKFLVLLRRLLVSKENRILKYVPHAFVNLCVETRYGYYMKEVFQFVVVNLKRKPSNVIVNHLILFREFVRKLNETFVLLKPTKVEFEASVVRIVEKMNDFLKDKDVQYLDLFNIRHFVLDRCDGGNLSISSNRWSLYNTIRNFPSGYIRSNFLQLFEILYEDVELNFLLEVFLDQTITYASDNEDFDMIRMIYRRLVRGIFSLNPAKLYRIFIESFLKLNVYLEHIQFDGNLPFDTKEINFYEAIVVQIISSRNTSDNKALCEESFKKLCQFSDIDNFELELLPKVLGFVHRNLDVLDKYSFLKFLFVLVLTDCDKGDVCDFLTKLCGRFTNEDNCLCNLLTYEFLCDFLKDDQVVRKFLVDALKLIGKFENNARFDTFYMDTYQRLQMHKDVINKMMSKFF